MIKRLVCLANSQRPNGRCVAGKSTDEGIWYRPIGGAGRMEIGATERQYSDGTEPALMDVMDIGLTGREAGLHQPENWTLDASHRWSREGRVTVNDLGRYADDPASIWSSGSQSKDGLNNRIPETDRVAASLYLLSLQALELDAHTVRDWYGRVQPRLSGEFEWKGIEYRLAVTDPLAWERYMPGPGRHSVGPAYVTVSLAEDHHGFCYKLIAAVVPSPG